MTSVVFVHPDDLAAIKTATGPAPIDAPRIESSVFIERGKVFGPIPETSYANMCSAKPAFDLRLDSDERINWPIMPSVSQYIARIEHGARFVPESQRQQNARAWCGIALARAHGNADWRKARRYLRDLLDPTYRHPRARRATCQS